MNKERFRAVKKEYASLREEERKKIIDCIAKKKDDKGNFLFTKANGKNYCDHRYGGGSGKTAYHSGHALAKEYDLSNYKYIETFYKGNPVLISLQSFDIDPDQKSRNIHVLYDRIGIIFGKTGYIKAQDNIILSDAFIKMETTDWELPLSNCEVEELVSYIMKHFDEMES